MSLEEELAASNATAKSQEEVIAALRVQLTSLQEDGPAAMAASSRHETQSDRDKRQLPVRKPPTAAPHRTPPKPPPAKRTQDGVQAPAKQRRLRTTRESAATDELPERLVRMLTSWPSQLCAADLVPGEGKLIESVEQVKAIATLYQQSELLVCERLFAFLAAV